jgi:D-serine deaminase-like pyridoxal phosphate-dependent protein
MCGCSAEMSAATHVRGCAVVLLVSDRYFHLSRLASIPELAEQPTPFLAIDLEIMERNIRQMADYFAARPASLRPHVKHHKCSRIARLQVDAGANGVTCSTTDEIVAMVRSGIDDVLLANVVADPPRLGALAAAAGQARVTVALDSDASARMLSDAADAGGVEIGFVVDTDIGMGRNGVASVEAGIELAEVASALPGLVFRGVMGYEGHIMDLPDRAARSAAAEQAFQPVASLVDRLRERGFDVGIVTGGSAATYESTGNLPFMTDIQCGTYVLMDAIYSELLPEFTPALAVIATVCTAGPDRDVVVNVGAKRMATDWGKPCLAHLDVPHVGPSEEHNQFAHPLEGVPQVGERVAVVPAHACSTMAMYSRAFGIRDGSVAEVLEIDGRDPLS